MHWHVVLAEYNYAVFVIAVLHCVHAATADTNLLLLMHVNIVLVM
jgi:hypothetical protein